MQSTIELFHHLYEHLPPLVPPEIVRKMKHALEHLQGDVTITLVEIEDTMIEFGHQVWPYFQAYREFLSINETVSGENFLLPRLSPGLVKKFEHFKKHGGTLRELHAGHPYDYFDSEERNELCTAFIDMHKELNEYTKRQVIGLDKQKYLKRVGDFERILKDIQDKLSEMNDLASREQDHPTLASEIRARVRSFEFGLCRLGPEIDQEAVCQSVDFFRGRKHDLNRMRGAHIVPELDFYEEEK